MKVVKWNNQINLYAKVYFVIPNKMRSTYFDKSVGEEISKKFMLPIKYCSCPGCGKIYGHHKTRTVKNVLLAVIVKIRT